MVDYEKQEEAQEIAMLTRKLSACSARPMIDGVRCPAMIFGDVLRGKTPDSQRLRPPLPDSTLQEILGVEVELWASRRNSGWPLTPATGHGQSLGFR
jgi:hypothetical protein